MYVIRINMDKRVFVLGVFISLIGIVCADDGVWINTSGGDWATPTNWAATPGPYPNGVDAAAGFIGFPSTDNQTITSSTTDITLGSLHLDAPNPLVAPFPMKIDFSSGDHKLIFSSANNVAELFIEGSPRILQGSGTGVRIQLDSDLDVVVDAAGQPQISGNIAGTGAFNLYGSIDTNADDLLIFSGSNSYTGGTFVHGGILDINAADDVVTIPQATSGDSITVLEDASVHHAHNNNYAHTAVMNVVGGFVDLLGTHQILNQCKILDEGNLTSSGVDGGVLELLETAPGFAFIVGNNAQIGSANLFTIQLHGGGIQYDGTEAGTATIPGPVTIDLGGTSELNVIHNDGNCVDLDTGDVTFINTILNKTGDGVLKFEGGTVPIFNLQEGTVIVGDVVGPETTTATGVFTVFPDGTLEGYQTLDAQAGVVNNGTITPGSRCPCNSIGSLTINGDYTQSDTGTLLVKVTNPNAPGTSSGLLVVDNGNVTLNGDLFIETLPGGELSVGDKFLVLDNLTGSLPISGNFSSLLSNLPPQLAAAILQDPNQVFVLIESACSSPPTPYPPSDFANLGIPLFTSASAQACVYILQQRERMHNLRHPCRCNKPLPCPIESNENPQKDLNPNILEPNRNSCGTTEVCEERKKTCNTLTLYSAYLGTNGEIDQISTQSGYDFDSSGGLIGMSYPFNRGGLGIEAGYDQVDANADANLGDYHIRSVFTSGYITFSPIPQNLFVDIALESRAGWCRVHRHVDDLTAEGKPQIWQWDGYIDVGYEILSEHWYLSPLASIEGIYLHIDDYTENHAGEQDIHVSHQNFQSLRSWLGMNFGGQFIHKNVTWMPKIRSFWLHEFLDRNSSIQLTLPAFNTSSRLKVFGGNGDFGVVGAELRAFLGNHFSITGSYDFYWNHSIQSHLFYGEIGVSW